MNALLEALYNKLSFATPDGSKTTCQCCGLQSSTSSGAVKAVRHMPDCELAKLYESEGGEVEWRSRFPAY